MKGKTGKMKGGGLARRGVGAALASGGMARGTPRNPGESRIASKPGMGVGSRPAAGMTRPGFPSGGMTRPGMSGPISRRAGGGKVKGK